MKILLVLCVPISVLFITLNPCSQRNAVIATFCHCNVNSSHAYSVYKVDSINNYYLIYAKYHSSLYKIVSKKTVIPQCVDIRAGGCYNFVLHSVFMVDGEPIIPAGSIYEVSGWQVDESTIIAFEGDSIRDIFYGDNIKGLCISEN